MSLIKVTKNGEITFDPQTNLYEVWDETYSDIVGTTQYPSVAKDILESYCRKYLGNDTFGVELIEEIVNIIETTKGL
jgi:hypothetical protein